MGTVFTPAVSHSAHKWRTTSVLDCTEAVRNQGASLAQRD